TRRRVDRFEPFAGSGVRPLAIDEQTVLREPLDGQGRGHQSALNWALRFSTYAAMPSFASWLWNSCCCSSRSIARASWNGSSAPVCTERLMLPIAFDAMFGGVNCFAYSITFVMNSSRLPAS